MEIDTPLGPDALLFYGMQARDELARVSEYRLDLLGARGDVNLDDILGKNVTVRLAMANDQPRYFNGYVTRFAQVGKLGRYHRYEATVRPWLWFLSRTADCRIFQNMTVPDILSAVFSDHATAEFALELTQTYEPWVYCVQYRETDLDFVSRLIEREGIYYYFRHADGHNTLVLTDSTSAHSPCPGAGTLRFIPPGPLARPEVEHVSRWEFAREVQPGVYVHDDYDMERPGVELRTQKAGSRGYAPSDYEIYDYPGGYLQKPEGARYADVRLDEFGTRFEVARADTNCRAVAAGYLVTLDGCPRSDQNREHLVVSTSYELEYGGYEGLPKTTGAVIRCRFDAISSAQQFRPARTTPRPVVRGPQTAVVVGPAGDEIYTDKYGRVKVQFHWDRYGQRDQNSSCWIRVSHPWAGKGWGAVATPRIGQEVIVDFLEGDPDQPIITGRVYNAERLPPFGFPAGAVVSGIKSDTHKGSGYNELAMDDTAGKEQVRIHAQYDMHTTVEHDQTTTVHRNRTDRIDVDDSESVGNNQRCQVGVNQATTVGVDQTLNVGANQTTVVGANRSVTVGASEDATVALQRTHTVGVNETISVGAAQEVTVGAMQAVTVGASQVTSVGVDRMVNVGSNQATSVGSNVSTTIGGDETRAVAGGRTSSIGKDDALTVAKHLVVDAGDSVTIKTGSASLTMKKDGTIVIKGKNVTVQGSGKINIKADSDVVVKGSKVGIN